MATKRKKITAIVIIVALVLVAINVYFFWPQIGSWFRGVTSQIQGSPAINPEAAEAEKKEVQETMTVVDTYVGRGDTQNALNTLEGAIQRTNSSEQKANLYEKKGMVLAGSDVDGAIVALESSVEENPTDGNTAYLAELYERAGDYQKAAEYYTQAYELYGQLEAFEDGRQIDAEYYKQKAAQMEAKVQ